MNLALTLAGVGVIGGLLVIPGIALFDRPQRGLLLLAALAPFDGLLLLADLPGFVNGWKEALVATCLLAAVLSPSAIPWREIRPPDWAVPLVGLLAIALIWSALVRGPQALAGLKIGYYYVLIVVTLLRCPMTSKDRDRLVTIIMSVGFITAVYGIAQHSIGGDRLAAIGYGYGENIRTAGGFLRSFSSFIQPFGFGLYLMMALLVGLAVALSNPRRWRNAIFLAASPILALGMLLSIVRGAYLGLFVGMAVLFMVRYRSLIVPSLLLIPLLLMTPARFRNTLLSSSSLGERSDGWEAISTEFLKSPFGIGIGSTGSAGEKAAKTAGYTLTNLYQPDSQYVKVLLEFGALGLWCLIGLLVVAFAVVYQTSRRVPDPDSALALGIAASIVAAIAASFVATYMEIFPMDVYFWLLLGVTASMTTPAPPRTNKHAAPPTATVIANPSPDSRSVL